MGSEHSAAMTLLCGFSPSSHGISSFGKFLGNPFLCFQMCIYGFVLLVLMACLLAMQVCDYAPFIDITPWLLHLNWVGWLLDGPLFFCPKCFVVCNVLWICSRGIGFSFTVSWPYCGFGLSVYLCSQLFNLWTAILWSHGDLAVMISTITLFLRLVCN